MPEWLTSSYRPLVDTGHASVTQAVYPGAAILSICLLLLLQKAPMSKVLPSLRCWVAQFSYSEPYRFFHNRSMF